MSDQAGRRELEEETGGEGSRSVSSTGVGAGRDGGGGGTDCGGFVAGEAPLCVWNGRKQNGERREKCKCQ